MDTTEHHQTEPNQLEKRCRTLCVELGLATDTQPISVHPLSGGVASDIAKVQIGSKSYCAKFALPKLKVKADWFAPVHRNAAEYEWLQVAARILPESAVKLYGRSDSLHGFVMAYLGSDNTYLWKSALLEQSTDCHEARQVGRCLGQIHSASTLARFDTAAFDNRDDFYALRIEPYLIYTASQHSSLAATIHKVANELFQNRQVLLHGDVSPKNILIRDSGPVLLDAECATMGDACFDPAFCINHLLLKAIHCPKASTTYVEGALSLWQHYASFVSWEPLANLESRVSQLIPMLMLARIDGKSPVEYLTDPERQHCRQIAIQLINFPVNSVPELLSTIQSLITENPS